MLYSTGCVLYLSDLTTYILIILKRMCLFSLLSFSMWKSYSRSQIQMWSHTFPLSPILKKLSIICYGCETINLSQPWFFSSPHWHIKLVIAKLTNYNLIIIVTNIVGIYYVLGTVLCAVHILTYSALKSWDKYFLLTLQLTRMRHRCWWAFHCYNK